MNATNVIPLSAPQAVPHGKKASPAAVNPVHVRFGAFELDEADARLLCDGTALTLAPRPFGLLCALARRPGALLTKNTLLDDVWGHQFVSESVLKTAISDVRTVLDDHPREPRFIETVSRRGYRFIAATTPICRTAAIPGAAPFRRIEVSEHPSFKSRLVAAPGSRRAEEVAGSGKHAVVWPLRKVDTLRQEPGCTLPKPVFPTREEVRYAHELRLQLRALLLCEVAPATEPWSVGAD